MLVRSRDIGRESWGQMEEQFCTANSVNKGPGKNVECWKANEDSECQEQRDSGAERERERVSKVGSRSSQGTASSHTDHRSCSLLTSVLLQEMVSGIKSLHKHPYRLVHSPAGITHEMVFLGLHIL